jgi:hypothetical protein
LQVVSKRFLTEVSETFPHTNTAKEGVGDPIEGIFLLRSAITARSEAAIFTVDDEPDTGFG